MIKFVTWNVHGWTEDKHNDLCSVISHYDPDAAIITETHFRRTQDLPRVPNYCLFRKNRSFLHKNATGGSGGVAVLIHERLLNIYRLHEIIDSYEGILGITIKQNIWL